MIQTNRASEKSFGITFCILFVVIFSYFYIYHNKIYYLLIILSFIFLFFSFFFKKILIVPNLLWFKLGYLLSRIFSPILYSIVFYFLIFPISLLIKLFSIRKKKNNNVSNWILCEKDKDTVKVDFTRQF